MTECSCPTFTLAGTSTTLYFPYPEWVSPDNGITKTVDLFNFWAGNIATVDRGIQDQQLSLGGTVCPCGPWEGVLMDTWLTAITAAMNDGEEFTINELGDCLNGVYVIKDFSFDTIPGNATCFSWGLKLERVRDV